MVVFLDVAQFLVLTLWVGAMFGFAALFAPVLFRTLPSREQAGAVAGQALARIDSLGQVTGGIMLVITALQAIERGWQAIDLGRLLLAVAMLALVVLNSVTIRQRIAAIRQQMGRPIDELAADDPLRLEHRRFHSISRAVYSVTLLLGTLLIVLSALRQ